MKIMLQHDETGRLLGWNEETGPIPYGYSVIQSRLKPANPAACKPVVASEQAAQDDAAALQAVILLEKVQAVAMAAEALHAANQLEMSAAAMGDRWRALEDALNEWRAGK